MAMTLEQRRMECAYTATRSALQQSLKSVWATVVMPFGTHVQRQGLLQALAFLERTARASDLNTARSLFVDALQSHLVNRELIEKARASTGLLETVAGLEAWQYMLVTRETLAISLWFKRAAQALCD